MRVTYFTAAAVAAAVCFFGACGGSTTSPIKTTAQDAGTGDDASGDDDAATDDGGAQDAGPDHGAPSTTYPAFKPEMGQLQFNGGGVMPSPEIVTITWAQEPASNVTYLEQFGDEIGGSNYWTAVVSEYGVGPATSGTSNHVHIQSNAPSQMSDQDIQNFLAQNAGSALPAPNGSQVYVNYLPASTTLVFQGQNACQLGVGGYHSATQIGGYGVSYAVLPRCGGSGQTGLEEATMAASHEMGEAVTDPFPNSGLYGFDAPHLAFDFFQQFQSENGDACEFYQDSFYAEQAPFSFAVQRQWSNKSGAAGHAPCVPPPQGPYFNVTPLGLQPIKVDLSQNGGGIVVSRGYKAQVGSSVTFTIGFYSDGPTSGPWNVTATSGNPIQGQTSRLSATIDPSKRSGRNGETTDVTVKVNSVGSSKAALLTFTCTMGSRTTYMPVLISTM